jgi:hypothetical protein
MATYHSGVRYNSGVRYSEVPPASPRKSMSKPKLELRTKSDAEFLRFTRSLIAATSGKPQFADIEPPDIEFIAMADEYEESLIDATRTVAEGQHKVTVKDKNRGRLERMAIVRSLSVDIHSDGDETFIRSAGLAPRAGRRAIGSLDKPQHLRAKMGTRTGEIFLQWEPVYGAKTYVLECRFHGASLGDWSQAKILTNSRFFLKGLVPGQEYAFRVRAVGAAGEGPWSDEAIKMAPA